MKALLFAALSLGLFLVAVRLLWGGSMDPRSADAPAPHQRYARLLAMDRAEFRWRVAATLLSTAVVTALFVVAAG